MRRWWVIPFAIFAASRVLESLLLHHLLGLQGDLTLLPGGGPPAHLGHQVSFLEGLANWDGAWYRQIAEHGYPAHLPRVHGAVQENAWAFYPLFPLVVRAVMALGASFDLAALIVNLAFGGLASCVLFRLVRQHASSFTAAMAVLGLMFTPMALIFEAAYTESLALLLVLLALGALGGRRYGLFTVVTLLLAVARPVALPLALVCGIHWLVRWRHRDSEPFERRDRMVVGAAALTAAASFGLWPLIVGLRTGEPNAYFLTQKAWAQQAHPGQAGWSSWLQEAIHLQHWWAVGVVVAIAAMVAGILLQRGRRVWGAELRIWTWAYPLYILGTVRPTTSMFRYLLLTVTPWWPLPEVSERARSVRARSALVAMVVLVGLVSQYFWLKYYFVIWSGRQGAP